MTTLSAQDCTPELQMVRHAAAPKASLTARLTLISLVIGIIAGAGGWYADRETAKVQIAQSKIDLSRAEGAFDKAMARTESTMAEMNRLLVTLMQSEAGLHSDVLNMSNRIDRIERGNNHP